MPISVKELSEKIKSVKPESDAKLVEDLNKALAEFIGEGGDINDRTDIKGGTLLHYAATIGNEAIVATLLAAPGVEVNPLGARRITPLHLAADRGHAKVVAALLAARGIDVNAQDNDGATPLHSAAYNGHKAVVEVLIADPRVDVNAKASDGSTPLNFAEENGQTETAAFLLKDSRVESSARATDERDAEGESQTRPPFDIDGLNKLSHKFKELSSEVREDVCRLITDNHGGSKWGGFIKEVLESVKNTKLEKAQYPRAYTNKDGSFSIFFESESPEFEEFKAAIEDARVVEQLQHYALQQGSEIIGGDRVLEVTEDGQCKFNLSLLNLDKILKLNNLYSGYKGDDSILSLQKGCELDPDRATIALMPVRIINDEEGKERYGVAIAGCQTVEVPALQLMYLLPNYREEILPRHQAKGFSFHWVPEEVSDSLCIDRVDIPNIFSGVLESDGFSLIPGDGGEADFETVERALGDERRSGAVKVVPLTEETRKFYLRYGCADAEELSDCYSLEIDKVAFLRAVEKRIGEVEVRSSYYSPEEIASAKSNIEKMITKAEAVASASVSVGGASDDRPSGVVAAGSGARIVDLMVAGKGGAASSH